MSTASIILDIVLVITAIWMVIVVRGLGGIVGKTLSLITIGAVITGLAHLLATLQHRLFPFDSGAEALMHRLIVLVGFAMLAAGFRQIRELRT